MKTLGLLPAVKIWKKKGKFYYDRKFYDGVLEYCNYWTGDIKCFMQISYSDLPKFGTVEHNNSIPFTLEIIDNSYKGLLDKIKFVDIFLISGDSFDYLNFWWLCRKQNKRCIYIIEYTLKTRMQIIKIGCRSLFSRKIYKKYIFLFYNEIKRILAFSRADGIQANGIGAYNSYRKLNRNTILYFDTRIRKKDIINEVHLSARLEHMKKREIHIGFSGRLTSIKGVEDLINVARILRKKNIPFKLFIYGDGDLYNVLESNIHDHELSDCVIMKGALSFYDKLLPELKDNIDIFVLPHKQGDPSCTYMETLSCGIPIIGYDNEAFAGLMQLADIGWIVNMNDVESIAKRLEELFKKKYEIDDKSKNAINLAKLNYFEKTFKNRIKQLSSSSQVSELR